MPASMATGGYDLDFSDKVDEDLKCAVCFMRVRSHSSSLAVANYSASRALKNGSNTLQSVITADGICSISLT